MAWVHWQSDTSLFTQRGKFRPRLTQLVQQNSPQDVESITKAGIAALPDLEKAIGILTQLKAVGPATASGQWLQLLPILMQFYEK